MDKKSIEALVVKAKTHDKESLEKLYNAFLPYIYILINKIYIQGFDKDDLKQECFITLYKCIDKYKGSDTFIAYATCSIKNNLIYFLRKSLSHQELPSDTIEPISNASVEDLVIKNIDISDINAAIKLLSAPERSILINYFLNDLSLMTISKNENSKYITTVKRKDRAIKKIKHYFKDE